MDVTSLISKDRKVIQSYAGGVFRISGEVYEASVVVWPDKVDAWSGVDVKALSEADFESLLVCADEIDVVLLGTGAKMSFIDPKLKASLSAKGLVVDCMDTGAACRTYNVLLAEGRRVVAALLPV